MSGHAGDNENNDPPRRHPQNLQGLLHFCTDITAVEDQTQPSQLQMDPERREFLQNALQEFMTDAGKEIAGCFSTLQNKVMSIMDDDITEQEEALDKLTDYGEDLNYAVDMQKMGGFPLIVQCLNSQHPGVRSRAAELIGFICQNIEFCQQHMLQLEVLSALLNMLDSDPDERSRVKALFAVSCLIRNFQPGFEKFMSLNGFSYLMRAMQSGIEKIVIKSVFLFSALVAQNEQCKETLLSMGYIEQLINILHCSETTDITREHCCSALLNQVKLYPPALEECMRPQLELSSLLRKRLKTIEGIEEYKEEESSVKELLKLFPEDSGEETCLR